MEDAMFEVLQKRVNQEIISVKESEVWKTLSNDEQMIVRLNTEKGVLLEIIEELQVDHDYFKSLLMFINNEAVGFIESGPYCENEPEIILETMKNIGRLSFVGEE